MQIYFYRERNEQIHGTMPLPLPISAHHYTELTGLSSKMDQNQTGYSKEKKMITITTEIWEPKLM